jgi:hypothetical protein
MVLSEAGKVLTVSTTNLGSDTGRSPGVTVFRKH